MRTEHMLPIAERMDRAGFVSMQAIALVQFDASVLFLNQDPFERIRLLRERMTRTPLRAAIRSNLMRGFFPGGRRHHRSLRRTPDCERHPRNRRLRCADVQRQPRVEHRHGAPARGRR